jgi:hypothetical protein
LEEFSCWHCFHPYLQTGRGLNKISLTNLDLDLLAPECSVALSFWGKYLIKMMAPFIFVGSVGIVILCKTALFKILKRDPIPHLRVGPY